MICFTLGKTTEQAFVAGRRFRPGPGEMYRNMAALESLTGQCHVLLRFATQATYITWFPKCRLQHLLWLAFSHGLNTRAWVCTCKNRCWRKSFITLKFRRWIIKPFMLKLNIKLEKQDLNRNIIAKNIARRPFPWVPGIHAGPGGGSGPTFAATFVGRQGLKRGEKTYGSSATSWLTQ